MKYLIDVPDGWRYGFPKELPEGIQPKTKEWDDVVRKLILDSKYPEEDLAASWFWIRIIEKQSLYGMGIYHDISPALATLDYRERFGASLRDAKKNLQDMTDEKAKQKMLELLDKGNPEDLIKVVRYLVNKL